MGNIPSWFTETGPNICLIWTAFKRNYKCQLSSTRLGPPDTPTMRAYTSWQAHSVLQIFGQDLEESQRQRERRKWQNVKTAMLPKWLCWKELEETTYRSSGRCNYWEKGPLLLTLPIPLKLVAGGQFDNPLTFLRHFSSSPWKNGRKNPADRGAPAHVEAGGGGTCIYFSEERRFAF